jgi:predicted double-glycine peptidase
MAAAFIAFQRIRRNKRDQVASQRSKLLLCFGLLSGFVALITMATISRFPMIPVRVMPIGAWAIIEREYWLPFAVLFFACASHLISRPNRRAMKALAAVLVVFVALMTGWRLLPMPMKDFGRKMQDGVCLQSSGYTCGAASLVTMLDRMRIEATEGEMAMLTGTIPGRGVTDFQATYGLQKKLQSIGRSETVEVIECADRDPSRVQPPFLAGIKYSFWFDHMVCVLEMHDDLVVMGDPLQGKRMMPLETFRDQWRGFAIVAQASQ